jgi:hypothetical protein
MNVKGMSCCDSMRARKRIIALSLGIIGMAFMASFFFTKNLIISLSLLVIPPLLFYPIACGAIGGLLWFVARPMKSKEISAK